MEPQITRNTQRGGIKYRDDAFDREAEELERIRVAGWIRAVREGTGLSQPRFAEVYRISAGRLRDLEQARTQPDSALMAYLTVIDREPKAVTRALRAKATACAAQ